MKRAVDGAVLVVEAHGPEVDAVYIIEPDIQAVLPAVVAGFVFGQFADGVRGQDGMDVGAEIQNEATVS